MKKYYITAIIAISFVWAGMLLGISFLEAPLKFQAPGITLSLGLGIGKLVFGALTKIELLFSITIVVLLYLNDAKQDIWIWFLCAFAIVLVDNAILMPILDSRIEMRLEGNLPPPSNIHLWYIILEVIKLLILCIAGTKTINIISSSNVIHEPNTK